MTLTALRDAVEAGECPSQADWTAIFPDTLDDDCPLSMMAVKANAGSVDGFLQLTKDTLNNWVVSRMTQRHGGVWTVLLLKVNDDGWHEEGMKRVEVWNADLARAGLLAILSAKIAEGE